MQANMHEAKSNLSRLADRAVKGERVIIAKAGEPYVELVPYCTAERPPFGWLKGEVSMDSDFDSPETNQAVADLFEGNE